jgi:hypothetical protein
MIVEPVVVTHLILYALYGTSSASSSVMSIVDVQRSSPKKEIDGAF